MEFLFRCLTGIGGLSGVVALVICWMAHRLVVSEKAARIRAIEEWKKLSSQVESLENEKFNTLNKKVEEHIKEVDDHIKEDRSQEILNELKHLSGSVNRLADKFDLVNQHDAEQKAKLEAHDLYLKNLNDTVMKHINKD